MKITASLCWWNEKPEDLAACVRGVANVADDLVAVDGAYRRYPGGTPKSDPEQYQALRDSAEAVGLPLTIVEHSVCWAGAVEKRTYAMATASIGSDWVLVVDTDHIIHGNREQIRADLERRLKQDMHDVVSVVFVTPKPDGDLAEVSATNWHRDQAGTQAVIPMFYRTYPGMRYELHHWTPSGIKNGQRFWYYFTGGSGPSYPIASAVMIDTMEVEHRCLFRSKEQILAARAYYNDRERVVRKTGQEDDVPGLNDPVWDYITVPL